MILAIEGGGNKSLTVDFVSVLRWNKYQLILWKAKEVVEAFPSRALAKRARAPLARIVILRGHDA